MQITPHICFIGMLGLQWCIGHQILSDSADTFACIVGWMTILREEHSQGHQFTLVESCFHWVVLVHFHILSHGVVGSCCRNIVCSCCHAI